MVHRLGSFARPRVLRRVVTIGVATALVLAACGSDNKSNSSSTAAPGGTAGGGGSDKSLVIARQMDVNSLDPSRAYCDTCQIFMTAVYETLIGLDSDNKTLVPRLATSWEANDAQTEFTFHLDPKAKFADGSPVTSADVKFSWERLKGLQGAASYLVSTVQTIDTPDPETVKVTMSQPNSAFLAQVNASYLGIVNSKVAQAQGATADPTTDKAETWFLSNSAGSGPFELADYTQGNELRFKRNDNYWGTKSQFPEVIIKETAEAATQRQQLEQGAVDIAMQISNDVAQGMGGSDVTGEPGAELQLRLPRAEPRRRGRRRVEEARGPPGDPPRPRLRRSRRCHRGRCREIAAVADPQRLRRHGRSRPAEAGRHQGQGPVVAGR
jgi:peptide/nickel transport system substrate-binding protein